MNKLADTNQPPTRRRAALVIVSILAACALVIAISTWWDWSVRSAAIRKLREMEANALGNAPPSPDNFYPIEVVPRQPVVEGFQIRSAAQAAPLIDDDETVLAVTVNGQSRAYPINVMTGPEREIFNDTLGGRAIAATW